jgi:mannose-P-dolichol utilization defect protein 1
VFTTLQEVKDSVLLWGFALATVFNGILAFQMIYYWNSSGEGKAEKKSKKKQ